MLKSNTHETFSEDHRFSRQQVEDAATLVASEGSRKRLLLNVTMGHRRLSQRQSFISHSLGVLLVLAVYTTEHFSPSLDGSMLNLWVVVSFLSIAARAALLYKVFKPLPVEMANSIGLRLLPLLIVLISAVHWMWTMQLFVGRDLTLTVFVLYAGFLGISIAVMGMWPTVPIVAVIYLVTTWPPFFARLYLGGWVAVPVLLLLIAIVVVVLWACVFLQVNQIQPILDRSDEVELLLAKLHDVNETLTKTNGALQDMRNDAASELESRSMFFSTASHDFRQRLHAMKLLTHGAIAQGLLAEQANAKLNRLASCVEDVEAYVTDVLDFARFDGAALRPNRRVVELQHIFQQLNINFEDVAVEKRVGLVVRATAAVLTTDGGMLQRMLENLISNAIKFSSGKVLVAARPRAGGIAIEVWDQGKGIAPEALNAIFSPFYQAAADPTGKTGVGLGLAVVKRFADCLEYAVSVRSRPNRGTVITVSIPARDVSNHNSETKQ